MINVVILNGRDGCVSGCVLLGKNHAVQYNTKMESCIYVYKMNRISTGLTFQSNGHYIKLALMKFDKDFIILNKFRLI